MHDIQAGYPNSMVFIKVKNGILSSLWMSFWYLFATAFFLIVIHVDSLSVPVTCLNKFEKYDWLISQKKNTKSTWHCTPFRFEVWGRPASVTRESVTGPTATDLTCPRAQNSMDRGNGIVVARLLRLTRPIVIEPVQSQLAAVWIMSPWW